MTSRKKVTKRIRAKTSPQLSWAALARELGVQSNTLLAWRRRPDSPKERDAAIWNAYVLKNNLGAGASAAPTSASGEAKLEQTRLENQLLQARIDRERRRVIPQDEVRQLLFSLSTNVRSRVYQVFETELPPKLDGMSSTLMRPILREEADKLVDAMADALKEFEIR